MGPICSGKNPCTSQEQCIDQCDGATICQPRSGKRLSNLF